MAAEKLIFLVVLSAILYEAVKADECVHDGDCHALGNRSRAVCCKNNILGSKCRKSCVGLKCSEDYNCGGAYIVANTNVVRVVLTFHALAIEIVVVSNAVITNVVRVVLVNLV